MKNKVKNEKLKSNKELLANLRKEANSIPDYGEGHDLMLAAADRIEALVAALVDLEIKLKTKG
jgi:hypothetical protein